MSVGPTHLPHLDVSKRLPPDPACTTFRNAKKIWGTLGISHCPINNACEEPSCLPWLDLVCSAVCDLPSPWIRRQPIGCVNSRIIFPLRSFTLSWQFMTIVSSLDPSSLFLACASKEENKSWYSNEWASMTPAPSCHMRWNTMYSHPQQPEAPRLRQFLFTDLVKETTSAPMHSFTVIAN